MSSILKVDQLQDSGGNEIITSNGSGTITVNSQPFKNGITMADQWRLTANTNTGTNADVTTNWERNNSTGYGSIGTGLTESSGIFSFPQTGIYWINYVGLTVTTTSDASINFSLHITLNNSSYAQVSMMRNGNEGARNGVGSNNFLFDVTDITNDKFKFVTANFTSGTALRGLTTQQDTGFTIIRIGDT